MKVKPAGGHGFQPERQGPTHLFIVLSHQRPIRVRKKRINRCLFVVFVGRIAISTYVNRSPSPNLVIQPFSNYVL